MFEIVVDDSIVNLALDTDPTHSAQKRLLSLINDFEDGEWRHQRFHNFIWDNIAETALSQQERAALAGQPQTLLREAAKNLRLVDKPTDPGRGSELAEIVLYGVMKHKYGALPVVPKIFYKQNSQDNAKGADSVHIVIADGDFTLWFGETKFYDDISNVRLGSILKSVEESLSTDKLKKENSIITNVSDLDELTLDKALVEAIKKALSPQNSIDQLKPRICVPILLLHECSITAATTSLTDSYREEVKKYHLERAEAYFQRQIENLQPKVHGYDDLRFVLILFPVPRKVDIVNSFLSSATHYKG